MDPTLQDPNSISDQTLTALLLRYDSAYTAGRIITRFGESAQLAGKAIGGILVLGVFYLVSQTGLSNSGGLVILGVALSLLVGGLIVILGVLLSAGGQILTASLDNSVNTSPFLSHRQRTKMMSLP